MVLSNICNRYISIVDPDRRGRWNVHCGGLSLLLDWFDRHDFGCGFGSGEGKLYARSYYFHYLLTLDFLVFLKTVTTNRLMTGSLALPSMELLFRMAPLAAVQSLIFGIVAGELPILSQAMSERTADGSILRTLCTVAFILGNGLLALVLNIASFQTNKIAGALTITVAGNLKQAITLALGIIVFGDFAINLLNGMGIFLVLAGCAFFSKVELDSKKRAASSS